MQWLAIHFVAHKAITIKVHGLAEGHATTKPLFSMEFNILANLVIHADTKMKQNVTKPHSSEGTVPDSVMPADRTSSLFDHVLFVAALTRATHHTRHGHLLEVLFELSQ
jgi:hypothetical protein